MPLPPRYQEVLEPYVHDLTKYMKDKKKREESKRASSNSRPAQSGKEEHKEVKEERLIPIKITKEEVCKLGDDEDKLVFDKRVNSLKINVNREREKMIKKMLNPQTGTNRNSKFFDPSLSSKSQTRRDKRKNNAFQFIEKGSIVKKGELMRGNTDDLSRSMQEDSEIKDENDVMNKLQLQIDKSSQVQIEANKVFTGAKRCDPIPNVEWWDAHLLPNNRSYLQQDDAKFQEENDKEKLDQTNLVERLTKRLELFQDNCVFNSSFLQGKINKAIEHPVAFNSGTSNQNPVIPVYLTKDEKKKLRRMKRQAKQKEIQEKISLGLMKPPPPKLKYGNFMNIMSYQAIMDPTQAEMEVRKAVQDRLQAHLDRNAQKKLTKQQKAEKNLKKLKRDAAVECRVAVFRVEDLSHGAHKFKVNMNAQQLALNGVCIVADRKLGLNLPSVVIVEGGPKAIKFYKKLMLRRVKWSANKRVEGEDDSACLINEQEYENKCTLVWEGISKDRSFNKWMVVNIQNELEARRLLANRGVECYWDRAMGCSIGTNDED